MDIPKKYVKKLDAELPRWMQVFDEVLYPFMVWLQGNNGDSVQSTHRYHCIGIRSGLPEGIETIPIRGRDDSKVKKSGCNPLFHMPRFGGWKNYVVLQPPNHFRGKWFVGWKYKGEVKINRIPIIGPVKMLTGPKVTKNKAGKLVENVTEFFGVNLWGEVLDLEAVGFGENGDCAFMEYPLL